MIGGTQHFFDNLYGLFEMEVVTLVETVIDQQ